MGYKDRSWCRYTQCKYFDPNKCDRVLSERDIKIIEDRNFMVSYYGDKPTCFKESGYK